MLAHFLPLHQLNNLAPFWAISVCFMEFQVAKSRGQNSVNSRLDQFTTSRGTLKKELQQASIEKTLHLAFSLKFSKHARTHKKKEEEEEEEERKP